MAEFGPLITTTGMFMGAPIYTEWKDDWGTMMEDFEVRVKDFSLQQ